MTSNAATLPITLNQTVSLSIQSDPAICSSVQASPEYNKAPASGGPGPKLPSPVSPAPVVSLRPIDVLHTLGLAMLPPRHVTQHLASWHWTLIRYGYLVEPAAGPATAFATNALAGDYRFHHMTALSEAFGVGCALSYAQAWLETQAPGVMVHDPIDFDYLLGPTAVSLPGAAAAFSAQMAPQAKRQPDYLVAAERQNGDVRLMIVECKGTSGPQTKAFGQLGSAMHQLAGIVLAPSLGGPVAIDRHAYASRVSKGGGAIEVYGVDPDDEGEPWMKPAVPPRAQEFPPSGRRTGRLRLPSPEEVSGRLLIRLDDRLGAWAGAGDSLDEVDVGGMRRRPSDYGDVVGTASSVVFPDGRSVEVFTGTLLEILEAAGDPRTEHARERREAVRRSIAGPSGESQVPRARPLQADENPERVASVISQEGLALRVEVT